MINKKLLHNDLDEVLDRYDRFNINSKINRLDALFMFRILFGRNASPDELIRIYNLNATYSEFLNQLVSSPEFSRTTRYIPPGHEFMAELPDFKFFFNTSDREMGVRMAMGIYETYEVELLKKFVMPGMTCIDAGAQTGFYTLHLAKLIGQRGKLYSFEPNPNTFRLLKKNVDINGFTGYVRLFNLGLSDVESESEATEVSNMYVIGAMEGFPTNMMQIQRGDDIVKERVDFIKIDIEGSEPAAIRGMSTLITRHHPIIFSEINEYWLKDRAKTGAQQYLDQLRSFHYRVYDIRAIMKKEFVELKRINLGILDTIDVICIPENVDICGYLKSDETKD